ncbi:MAG: phosphoribosylamine--glycine ligase, partial [Thiotrichales bacterium]|nr:phosphoribosylamine--glycine ligase [Thiotrichales bacterium]
YTPAPVVTRDVHDRIMKEVIEPTIEGMAKDGLPYTGFLYAGVMISPDGAPKVLEFNCRFGDPETQPIMMRLQSDLNELCLAALDKRLNEVTAKWDFRAALGVVMAAGGYPDDYRKGDVIKGLDSDVIKNAADIKVFHAGTTANENGEVVTAGGRVLCVTALGENVTEAQKRAYIGLNQIQWDDVYFRTDIGHRAISRESVS